MTTTSSGQRFALPDWMLPHHRALDWGLVLVVALSLLAALPFLANAGLPRETDAELHVFRVAELTHAIREGVLYPRWAPNFWYGYGYPFFNYYGSLTYYLAAGYSLLTGNGPVEGARFVFILGLVLAGVGTYSFVRRRWNAGAGVVAAVVYAFSPYVMLVDPHMRGDLAEAFALGLFPGVLWAFDRLLVEGQGRHIITAMLLLAALIFTHNLMALIFFILLCGWLAWLRLVAPARFWRRGLLAVLLGLGAASFFWIPVLLEANQVQLDRLVGPGHFDYQQHFLSISELLRSSPPLDLGAANPAYAHNLGTAAWVLALVGGAAMLFQWQRGAPPAQAHTATVDEWRDLLKSGALNEIPPPPGGSRDAAYFALAALVLVLLLLPISGVVWQAVPAMPVLQFPWRLLGPAAFCLAVIAGASTRWLHYLPGTARVAGLGVLVAVPLFAAIPALYPPEWGTDFGETTPQAYLAFERSGVALGTTAGGEFLPSTVLMPPGPQTTLIDSYAGPGPVDKVNRATLPRETRVDVISHGPTEDRFLVVTREPFPLRLYTFMFPGWRAEIDGRPAEIEVAAPEGFIVVNIPSEGTFNVRVFLGSTLARDAATGITVAALTLGAVLAIALERQTRQPASYPHLLGRRSAAAVLIAGLLFVAMKAYSDARPGWLYLRSAPGEALPALTPHHQSFEDAIDLIAYDLPRLSARPGEALPVTLYWRATAPIEHNYQVFVHLTPTGGLQPAAQSDKLNPGDYPTTRWSLERYVRDAHNVALPPDLAPGQYIVSVGLYDLNTGDRLALASPEGDDKVVLPDLVEIEG